MILGPAQTLPIAQTTTDVEPYVGACILHGWGFLEPTNAATAKFELTDGVGGPLILPVTLAINQSFRDWLAGTGIYVRQGLNVRMVSGTVSGALWIRPVRGDDPQLELDVHGALAELADLLHRPHQ